MNIYVGNLAYTLTNEGLSGIFEEFGAVSRANIIMDRDTGRSKGFGFVEMDNDDEAKTAIESLNGAAIEGRNLRVNEAQPREQKPRSFARR